MSFHRKLTSYEIAKIIGIRASMIENGSPTVLSSKEVEEKMTPYDLAMKEFRLRKIPIMVKRFVNHKGDVELVKIFD